MKFNQNWNAYISDSKRNELSAPFPAEVPGNVQYDYAKALGRENFFYGTDVSFFDALEGHFWKYAATLDFSAKSNERVYFTAEGIDYKFDIFLDGVKLFSGEGMYTKTELEITEHAKCGSVIEVLIYPHPKSEGSEPNTRSEADQSCKAPVSYGWDWCPRLLISGLWKDAYIETRADDYIDNCELFYKLSDDLSTAYISFEADCKAEVTYTLSNPDGKLIYRGTDSVITVDNIELWWCNGQGEPNLYSWTAETSSDKKSGKIGFRKVRLVQNEGTASVVGFPKGRYASPITIELNGRRIFAKGTNYVNPEVFFGRIKQEIYDEQLLLAKKANMNIVRCWGGAGIAKKEFFDYCDKYGIMVWQEFMLACNNYRGTPHYLAVLESEATEIVKQLRHHASLVMWCGGNELFNNWSNMTDQSKALRLLNKICYENDPETPFLMTSPEYGMAHGGYTFYDSATDRDVFSNFANSHNTAYTEFGVPSITQKEALKKIIPENELYPITPTASWVKHHGFRAWVGDSWACLSILNKYFPHDNSLEETIAHSNELQSMGYKAIFEESRRQWPHCSMALNWCFNEPWITAAGNSLLTYPSKPKQAYYAVAESLQNRIATARIPKFDWQAGELFSAQLWYHNDDPQPCSDGIDAILQLGNEKVNLLHWDTGEVAANGNKIGPTVNFVLPTAANTDNLTLTLMSGGKAINSYRLLYKTDTDNSFVPQMNGD